MKKELPKLDTTLLWISGTDEQITYFINFIDEALKRGPAALTMENKLEIHSAFRTLVKTAQREILVKVAANLKEIQETVK